MRAVIDTNVLISALLTHRDSSPRLIYRAILQRRFTSIASIATLDELEEVLNRPAIAKVHRLTAVEIGQLVDNLAKASNLVPGELIIQAVPDDPKDDKFVAAAIEGQADYIVSGDHHLLSLGEYRGVRILTARQFVSEVLDAEK